MPGAFSEATSGAAVIRQIISYRRARAS